MIQIPKEQIEKINEKYPHTGPQPREKVVIDRIDVPRQDILKIRKQFPNGIMRKIEPYNIFNMKTGEKKCITHVFRSECLEYPLFADFTPDKKKKLSKNIIIL